MIVSARRWKRSQAPPFGRQPNSASRRMTNRLSSASVRGREDRRPTHRDEDSVQTMTREFTDQVTRELRRCLKLLLLTATPNQALTTCSLSTLNLAPPKSPVNDAGAVL